jgi:hypothetical protein
VTFHPGAMADVDSWVRHHGRRLMFVYGERDPWGAERFDCGPAGADRACTVHEVAGADHSASIGGLPRAERRAAIRQVRSWAGLTTTRAALPGLEARAAAGARAARRATDDHAMLGMMLP